MSNLPPGVRATFVIVAAGRSERFGGGAKLLAPVAGHPVLEWSLLAAEAAESVADVVIVTGSHTRDAIAALANQPSWRKPIALVAGGAQRQDSVAAGVAATPETSALALVHDGARPLVSPDLIDRCAIAAWEGGAAIAATPVGDTLKRVSDGAIEATVSRSGLWAAQTPQGFRLDVLRDAIAMTRTLDAEFTDEASLLEALGMPVRVVPGERANIKVTHREDLEIVDALLRFRIERARQEGESHG